MKILTLIDEKQFIYNIRMDRMDYFWFCILEVGSRDNKDKFLHFAASRIRDNEVDDNFFAKLGNYDRIIKHGEKNIRDFQNLLSLFMVGNYKVMLFDFYNCDYNMYSVTK